MKLFGKIILGLVLLIGLGVGVITIAFANKSSTSYNKPQFSIHEEVLRADVELGRRIYFVRNGCVDCHGENLAGTKIVEDPAIGTVYGANLTPAKLKDLTDEEVATAIRYGIHKSGRSLRFMPSFDYEGLSKTDTAAVIAFLRQAPEVQASPPENSFGPVTKVLSVLGKMPVMFPAETIDPTKPFGEKPEEAATVEFGKYLANSCIGCHGTDFSGGPIPGGDPSWPPAANIRLGTQSAWNEEKFKQLITTGISPQTQQPVRAPMPIGSLKQMNEIEIKALWLFLQSLQ